MTDRPEVGLVLPVFNGAEFIARNVRLVLDAFDRAGTDAEVVVVTDGCSDDTADEARSVADPRVTVIECPVNRGKGAVVADGLLRTRARYVGWLDADLDIAPDTIVGMHAALRSGEHDIVVGSKRHPASRVDYPWIRRVYSWGYQSLVRTLVRVAVRDTQVGAKLMRHEVAELVVPLLLVKRYAFDLELLAVAAEFGFDRVAEAPIVLDYRFTGSGIDARAVLLMLTDTLAIAYRIHVRHWYARRFAAVYRARVDGELPAGSGASSDFSSSATTSGATSE